MKILALQLKRIGDVVLTTPALTALQKSYPAAKITLGVHAGSAGLLPLLPQIDGAIVFGPRRGFAPWQQVMTGAWQMCFDFTGSDRSALATTISRAPRRMTFAEVKRRRLVARAYTAFADSPVREMHTIDHYLDLVRDFSAAENSSDSSESSPIATPVLSLPEAAEARVQTVLAEKNLASPFAILHPWTARPEKNWQAQKWAELAREIQQTFSLRCVLTGSSDAAEKAHLAAICAAAPQVTDLSGALDLCGLAALTARARLVISTDTAIAHLASAFRTPQITLFGPTNPFHWRPRHPRALVLSAAHPGGPLTEFSPRMRGAPMEDLSTELVIRATHSLLAPAR